MRKTFRTSRNWKEFEINGYIVQALVFDVESIYGIDNGRISKLWIKSIKTQEVVYNYDRGLDFDKCKKGLLDLVIKKSLG